jgi:RsiW-degrading membrane proteinase PrsW (M82 family)
MWAGECPTQQLFEAIWEPIFSFIIILLISQSFYVSALSLPQNEYQSFWKKTILFLIFHKFWNLFFDFIFSYSFFGTYSAPLEQVS